VRARGGGGLGGGGVGGEARMGLAKVGAGGARSCRRARYVYRVTGGHVGAGSAASFVGRGGPPIGRWGWRVVSVQVLVAGSARGRDCPHGKRGGVSVRVPSASTRSRHRQRRATSRASHRTRSEQSEDRSAHGAHSGMRDLNDRGLGEDAAWADPCRELSSSGRRALWRLFVMPS